MSEVNRFASTPTEEILSLESSSTDKIMYSAEDAQMWLLDSGTDFHVTPHRGYVAGYSRNADSICLQNIGSRDDDRYFLKF